MLLGFEQYCRTYILLQMYTALSYGGIILYMVAPEPSASFVLGNRALYSSGQSLLLLWGTAYFYAEF